MVPMFAPKAATALLVRCLGVAGCLCKNLSRSSGRKNILLRGILTYQQLVNQVLMRQTAADSKQWKSPCQPWSTAWHSSCKLCTVDRWPRICVSADQPTICPQASQSASQLLDCFALDYCLSAIPNPCYVSHQDCELTAERCCCNQLPQSNNTKKGKRSPYSITEHWLGSVADPGSWQSACR